MTAPQQIRQATAVALRDPAELATTLAPLTDLLTRWRSTPTGQTLADALTPEQRTSALSTLNGLSRPGDVASVALIVKRLLAMYPQPREVASTVAEDWVRVLQEQPLASIWAAYEKTIRKPGQFAPSLGDFLQAVRDHAAMVSRLRLSVMGERA